MVLMGMLGMEESLNTIAKASSIQRHLCQFQGEQLPLGSDTKGGEECLATSVFWQVQL